MTRFRASAILLLCIALLVVRGTGLGMHVHLCFDGSEPPVALHVAADAVDHQHPGIGPLHEDVDVSLVGDMLGKIVKATLNLPVLLLACVLLLFSRTTAPMLQRAGFAVPIRPSARHIRPPLRAPPL